MKASPPNQEQQAARINVYEVRPADRIEGFDLISAALSAGRLHFTKQHVAIGYATLHSGSNGSIIRVYDSAGELTETHEQPAAHQRR